MTITGLGSGVRVPIQVAGGQYSINGDSFTALAGYVANGDQVMVSQTSASTRGVAVTTMLRVGGIVSATTPWVFNGSRVVARFTTTTQ